MFEKKTSIQIPVPGGVISPARLREVGVGFHTIGIDHISIGARQQWICRVPRRLVRTLQHILETDVSLENPNISSAMVCSEEQSASHWIGPDVYLEIFDQVRDFHPEYSLNFSIPGQSWHPLLNSRLNFIALEKENLWQVVVRQKDAVIVMAESCHSDEIPRVVKNFVSEEWNLPAQANVPVIAGAGSSPVIEGWHRLGETWSVGIKTRENQYPVLFLDELGMLASETGAGRIYLTSWNSILIRGIAEEFRPRWDELFLKYGIHFRHSGSELFWQLWGDRLAEKKLLRKIRRKLHEADVPSEQYSYAFLPESIHSEFKDSYPETSVIFRPHRRFFRRRYDLLKVESGTLVYSTANPASAGIRLSEIPAALLSLLDESSLVSDPEKEGTQAHESEYECPQCKTRYIPDYGDPLHGIPPKTRFAELPVDYACYLCGLSKKDWVLCLNYRME